MRDECREPASGEQNRSRRPLDEALDTRSLGSGSACSHARGAPLEASPHNPNCACDGVIARRYKRQFVEPEASVREWQLVRVCSASASDCSSHHGIVLSSNYLPFALSSNSETEVTEVFSTSDSSRRTLAIGLLMSGRITPVRSDSLSQVSTTSTRFDVASFSHAITRACSNCHHGSNPDISEETKARNFISKMQSCGCSARPTFESIFDCICTVCFDHGLEDSCRASFLQALRCVCSFKSFQTRFMTGRGALVLISLLHSCRSCLSADLALNCIAAIMANAAFSTCDLLCPQLIEALRSLIDRHVSTASKTNAILEQW